MAIQKHLTLKNGINFLFVEDKSVDVCALGLSVSAGTYFEHSSQNGISHLLEHLIGRSNIGKTNFRQATYALGGILDASTSIYKTYYYLICLPENSDKLLSVFVKGIFDPQLSEKDLLESKESIVSELAYVGNAEPYMVLREMMWKDNRLAKPITGSKTSLLPLNLKNLEEYHQTNYCSGGVAVVCLASSLPKDLIKTLETIPGSKSFEVTKTNHDIKAPTFRVFQERNLKSSITVAFPTKGYEGIGEGKHYFNLAVSTLMESRIAELGSKGLIYGDSWVWNVFPENGDLVLFLDDVDSNHLLPVIRDLMKTLEDWSYVPLESREFDIIRKHKILDLKTHTSVFEKITLLTKSLSTSEGVHTYNESIKVYEKANQETTLKSVKETLLTQKPFIVVSAGVDLEANIAEIENYLERYYSS